MSSKAQKILSLASQFEKNAAAGISKKADANAFYNILSNYEKNSEAVKDFVAAMKKIAENFKGTADMNDSVQARIYQLLSKQAEFVESCLADVEYLDSEMDELENGTDSGEAKDFSSKKAFLNTFDKLIAKFAQSVENYGGEGVHPSMMSAEQLAQRPGDLDELYRQSLISPAQYNAAKAIVDKGNPNIVQIPEGDSITGSRSTYHFPADTITAKPPTKTPGSRFPAIDKTFQTMLGVSADGALGPQTQAALNAYKKTIGQPNISNELAFEALKREPQYASKQEIAFDDNANVYKVTRQQTAPEQTLTQRMNSGEAPKTTGV